MTKKALTTGELEEDGWREYLMQMGSNVKNGMSKSSGAVPVNQLNHFGANIVKSRATKVALAQTILMAQKAKKGLGLKGNQKTETEKVLEVLR